MAANMNLWEVIISYQAPSDFESDGWTSNSYNVYNVIAHTENEANIKALDCFRNEISSINNPYAKAALQNYTYKIKAGIPSRKISIPTISDSDDKERYQLNPVIRTKNGKSRLEFMVKEK